MDRKIPLVFLGTGLLLLANVLPLAEGEKTGSTVPISTVISTKRIEEKTDILGLHFTQPTIHEYGEYVYISMDGINSWLTHPDEPQLPCFRTTLSYPLGTRIDAVTYTIEPPQEITLPKQIIPISQPLPFDRLYHSSKRLSSSRIYNETSPYPGDYMSYQITVGLEDNQPVIFLSLQVYPFQYYPKINKGEYIQDIEIEISYKPAVKALHMPDVYDLLIITPSLFSDNLQELVIHKETLGVKTKLVKVEDICQDTRGKDSAEKIKYYIKNALEQWGIQYVLLVGGMKGQLVTQWHVPVRYVNLDDNSSWETTYISDLYYADIYKYQEGDIVFDDWDSNNNDIFGEWSNGTKDILDLHPDVYVGRLPCRNKYEVDIMVDKIMRYETNTYGDDWFKRMVVVGGDSHNDLDVGTDYLEGQLSCDEALKYMDGFDKIRIYVKGGDEIYTSDTAVKIISLGAGFVYFSGHGNPMGWSTHPYQEFDTWIDFSKKEIKDLENNEKLPVLVVGGCHNSQFNVSVLRLLTDGLLAFWKGEATPECWGWIMTRKINGGSIATLGNTGLGYGSVGDGPVDEVYDSIPDDIPDCIQYMGGWIESHFFETYNYQGKEILGETWGVTITDYVNTFPIDWARQWIGEKPYSGDIIDCKTVQEWVLFGDPSLKIGGYPHLT